MGKTVWILKSTPRKRCKLTDRIKRLEKGVSVLADSLYGLIVELRRSETFPRGEHDGLPEASSTIRLRKIESDLETLSSEFAPSPTQPPADENIQE